MSFWASLSGKTLRWILFLPIGIILAALLEMLLLAFVNFATEYHLTMNLLSSLLLLLALPIGITLGVVYIATVVNLPRLVCGWIAPSNRISSVALGLFFLISQTLTILGQIGNVSTVIIFSKVLFSLLFLGGTVFVFFEPKEVSS
jgi:hypothetical protein